MWSSIFALGGAASAAWVLMGSGSRSNLVYPGIVTALAVVSALNHSRPYGGSPYDTLDALDRVAIVAACVETLRIFVNLSHVALQAAMAALFGALTVTYLCGTCRALYEGAPTKAAWLQVLTHVLSAAVFVLAALGVRLNL